MKPDQERVRTLLTDTVTLLCKNGLQYSKELKVQGLLGITLDNDDVFVVHINEIFNGLLGAQVAVRAEESSVSAIAAADSATSDISLKSRKGIPHKYECPSPSGSSKRKARPPTMNPLAHVKQEHSEDEIVIMDTKSLDSAEFNADEIGEGDREAMRKSYGEMLEAPPAKRRVADSSGSFREKQSGGLLGGIIKDTKDKLGDSDNFDNLEGSSLDDSSSGLGPMTSDGQTAFDNSAGCSAWEGQEIGQGQSECGQDSKMVASEHTYSTSRAMRVPRDVPPGTEYIIVNSTDDPGQRKLVVKIEDDHEDVKLPRVRVKHVKREPIDLSKAVFCKVEGCTAIFRNFNHLKKHMGNVHNAAKQQNRRSNAMADKPFKCAVENCEKSYYHYKDLRRHLVDLHGLSYQGEWKPLPASKQALNLPYKCPFCYCFGEYETAELLREHVIKLHPKEVPPLDYDELPGGEAAETEESPSKSSETETYIDLQMEAEAVDEIEAAGKNAAAEENETVEEAEVVEAKAGEVSSPVTRSRGRCSNSGDVGAGMRHKGRYICTFTGCIKSYPLNNSLVRHMLSDHNLMEILLKVMKTIYKPGRRTVFYECKECLYTAGRVANAVKHYHTSHGSLPGECDGGAEEEDDDEEEEDEEEEEFVTRAEDDENIEDEGLLLSVESITHVE